MNNANAQNANAESAWTDHARGPLGRMRIERRAAIVERVVGPKDSPAVEVATFNSSI